MGGTAIKHPVPDRVKLSLVIFDIRALWCSVATVGIKELISVVGWVSVYCNVCQVLTAVSGFALTATKLMVFRSDVTLIFCRHRTNWQLLICFTWSLLLIQLQVVCLCVTRTLKLCSATSELWLGQEYRGGGILPELFPSSSIVLLSIAAQSFEQLTGSVYQILLHLTGFTHCAEITLYVLDYFLVLYLHACCIIVTWWGEGTAVAVPPPFRPDNTALCGSCPLVTPYYCRLGDLLCVIWRCIFLACTTLYLCVYFVV